MNWLPYLNTLSKRPRALKYSEIYELFPQTVKGIFDNSDFTNYFLNRIREKKGLDKTDENFSFSEYKNREYDKLAQVLRENLDLKKIYEIMEIEK